MLLNIIIYSNNKVKVKVMIISKNMCDICKYEKSTIYYDKPSLQYFYYDIYLCSNWTYTKTNNFSYLNVEKLCEKCLDKLLDDKQLKHTIYDFDGSIDRLFVDYPKIKIIYIDFFLDYLKKVKVYKEHLDYVINYLYVNKDNLECINNQIIAIQLEAHKNNIL